MFYNWGMNTDGIVPLSYGVEAASFAGLTVSGGERRRRRAAVWNGAMCQWLAEKAVRLGPKAADQAEADWQRIYESLDRLPWELTAADIAAHAACMGAQGCDTKLILGALLSLDEFYEFCRHRQIDGECPGSFNPAAGVIVEFWIYPDGPVRRSKGEPARA
jgi:hypothetical protein